MQNDNIIIWQKWIDPFGRDDEENKNEEFSNYAQDTNNLEDDETYDQKEKVNEFIADKKIRYGVKVIATPMGIIPVNDNTSSGKIFNFWMGHTNFDITNDTKKILDATEGVEVLKIFSRYRFFIGVGKMFKFQNVRNNIEKELLKGDL